MGNEDQPSGACEICGSRAKAGRDWAILARDCPRCGTFTYDSTVGWLDVETPDHMVRLSGWVREQNDAGIVHPYITPETSRRVKHMHLPRLRDRANRALAFIARKYPSLQRGCDPIELTYHPELLGRSYSVCPPEAEVLIQILKADGFLDGDELVCISTAGLLAAEALTISQSDAALGFVAMSFDETLRTAWTSGFDPAIRAAGFIPARIDAKDYVGGISDEIMTDIRRSRFVVADYTGQKNGVYFEAGFALGLGITVIPTCRANEISDLHFDIKHLNTLPWTSPTDLMRKLRSRIMAVVGTGPNFVEEP